MGGGAAVTPDRDMLIAAAREAAARDCIGMEWNVLDWNTTAIDFYHRIGGKPVRGWIAMELGEQAMKALAEGARNG